ncbi:hypothetical protein DFAR_1140008 [Desulfarculales bacterium]
MLRTSGGLDLSQSYTHVAVTANAMVGQEGQQERTWEGDNRRFLGDLDVWRPWGAPPARRPGPVWAPARCLTAATT